MSYTKVNKARRSLAEFGHWLNNWGWEDQQPKEHREGYEQAIRDAYDLFNAIYPEWSKR